MDAPTEKNQHHLTKQSTISSPPNVLNTSKAGTPSLAQIGKQSSVNFRLSQLSDSGAESCDADEQTRLLHSPSTRSHKFIIIPSQATPPTQESQTKLSKSKSSASLKNIIRPSSPATHRPILAHQLSTTSAGPHNTKSKSHSSINLKNSNPQQTSDVIHQLKTSSTSEWLPPLVLDSDTTESVTIEGATSTKTLTTTPTAARATDVKFTIEDCETDNAISVSTSREASKKSEPTISSINTVTNFTPNAVYTVNNAAVVNSSLPRPITTTCITITRPPQATTTGSNSGTGIPKFDVTLRARNSSMRSVVSAYLPDTSDSTYDQSFYFQSPKQYLHPMMACGDKELSASSHHIFHDHGANQIYSDLTSVRSLASIGIGSTDGRKLVIRRVPTTPNELFSLVHPPSPRPPGVDNDDDDSFMDMSDEASQLKPRQQHWGSKMQFVLACIGYSVGLGNVWRFPYMCYKSGGGVFLVPYCIILFVCSIPLLFMELAVGQYTGRGPIGALGQLCPLFKGAGLASVVVSFLMSTYYSVIIAYSIYYFFTSFKSYMPWVDCSNRWNTPDCWVPQPVELNITAPATSRTPSEEFFENKVLQISPGIEYPGAMRWELFVCLICAWLMVYFATWKSIKSSAKVRYFTATFPFVLIIILMFRAVTLNGADEGLRYFFRPNWSELKNANVWINAASQNFNSLGITFGSMISFASYNKYSNNIVRDTIAVFLVNILTSLLVGVFAFATLGNLALEQNTNVKNVIGDGPGLIFVVYPQAMAKMPYAQLWAVMFFFMLLCLGLNSQFAIVEVVVTSIQDGFPNWIKRHLGYHEIVVLIVCIISFLFGLPNLIQGGIYFFQLMDHYAASVTIMFLAFCQMIAIAWFYGTERLSKNVKQMTGKAPSLYLKSCWIFFGPCLLFAIWVLSLVNYQEPSYHNGRYKYPEWAYGIGWMFASFSLVCIPGYAIINLLRSTGNTFWEHVRNTLRPNIYECRICGEHHCEHGYPEQEQYMLAQEISGMYKPGTQIKPTAFNTDPKAGYNLMTLQQQQQQQHQEAEYSCEKNFDEQQNEQMISQCQTSTVANR